MGQVRYPVRINLGRKAQCKKTGRPTGSYRTLPDEFGENE